MGSVFIEARERIETLGWIVTEALDEYRKLGCVFCSKWREITERNCEKYGLKLLLKSCPCKN